VTSDAAVAEFTHFEQKVYSHSKLVSDWKKDHEEALAATLRQQLVKINFQSMVKFTVLIWDQLEQIKTAWTDGITHPHSRRRKRRRETNRCPPICHASKRSSIFLTTTRSAASTARKL